MTGALLLLSWRDFEQGGGVGAMASQLARRCFQDPHVATEKVERVARILRLVQPSVEVGKDRGELFMRIAPKDLDAVRIAFRQYLHES